MPADPEHRGGPSPLWDSVSDCVRCCLPVLGKANALSVGSEGGPGCISAKGSRAGLLMAQLRASMGQPSTRVLYMRSSLKSYIALTLGLAQKTSTLMWPPTLTSRGHRSRPPQRVALHGPASWPWASTIPGHGLETWATLRRILWSGHAACDLLIPLFPCKTTW